MLAGVKMNLLEVDADFSVRGETLARAVAADRAKGLIPFCMVATLGTTTAMDSIQVSAATQATK